MPVQHAVLALLADGPTYGYELRRTFERTVGPGWGDLNIGHLYQILDRLRRDELIRVRDRIAGERRPDRTIFELTPTGREELDRWLAAPVVATSGVRDDFFLKLMAASRQGPGVLGDVIRTERSRHLAELKSIGELRGRATDDPLAALLIDAAATRAKGALAIVDAAEAQSEALLTAATSAKPEGGETSLPTRRAAG